MLISSKYYNILLNGKMWNLRNKNKVVHKRVFCARFLILEAPVTLDGGLSGEFTSRRICRPETFRRNVFVYVLISKKLRFSRHDVNRFLLLEGLWRKLFYRIFDLQCTIKFIMQLRFVKIHFSCFRKIDYKNS